MRHILNSILALKVESHFHVSAPDSSCNVFFSNLGANNSPEIPWLIQIHAVYTSALPYVLNESKHTAGIPQNVKIAQNTGGIGSRLHECGTRALEAANAAQ